MIIHTNSSDFPAFNHSRSTNIMTIYSSERLQCLVCRQEGAVQPVVGTPGPGLQHKPWCKKTPSLQARARSTAFHIGHPTAWILSKHWCSALPIILQGDYLP
ncbi:hypothetical protein XENTR_v10013514 [Xenopus tropicalis]|nr:hypothetical protein XENTR_v10013514 [Xenopus tropicalis]